MQIETNPRELFPTFFLGTGTSRSIFKGAFELTINDKLPDLIKRLFTLQEQIKSNEEKVNILVGEMKAGTLKFGRETKNKIQDFLQAAFDFDKEMKQIINGISTYVDPHLLFMQQNETEFQAKFEVEISNALTLATQYGNDLNTLREILAGLNEVQAKGGVRLSRTTTLHLTKTIESVNDLIVNLQLQKGGGGGEEEVVVVPQPPPPKVVEVPREVPSEYQQRVRDNYLAFREMFQNNDVDSEEIFETLNSYTDLNTKIFTIQKSTFARINAKIKIVQAYLGTGGGGIGAGETTTTISSS